MILPFVSPHAQTRLRVRWGRRDPDPPSFHEEGLRMAGQIAWQDAPHDTLRTAQVSDSRGYPWTAGYLVQPRRHLPDQPFVLVTTFITPSVWVEGVEVWTPHHPQDDPVLGEQIRAAVYEARTQRGAGLVIQDDGPEGGSGEVTIQRGAHRYVLRPNTRLCRAKQRLILSLVPVRAS